MKIVHLFLTAAFLIIYSIIVAIGATCYLFADGVNSQYIAIAALAFAGMFAIVYKGVTSL